MSTKRLYLYCWNGAFNPQIGAEPMTEIACVSTEEFDPMSANMILRIALTKRLNRLLGSELYQSMTLAQKLEARREIHEIQNKINDTFE